jgi:hypothetical protein
LECLGEGTFRNPIVPITSHSNSCHCFRSSVSTASKKKTKSKKKFLDLIHRRRKRDKDEEIFLKIKIQCFGRGKYGTPQSLFQMNAIQPFFSYRSLFSPHSGL